MQKKWMGISLSLVLAAGIAGCGGNGNNTGSATNGASESTATPAAASVKPPTSEPVQLKYWTDDRHDQEYIKEMINKFN